MLIQRKQLQKLLRKSDNCSQVLAKLGFASTRNNLRKILYIQKWKLDTSNLSAGFKKGHQPKNTVPLTDILVENSQHKYNTTMLKKRLIRDGYFEHKCYKCNNTEWLGQKIPVQLEHKNGINTDNRLSNLTLLCPNCHTFTDTFCGKNTAKARKNILEKKKRALERIQERTQKKEKNRQKRIKKKELSRRLIQKEHLRDKKRLIENRLKGLEMVDVTRFGWVQRLSKKWMISHTQVRKFLKKYKPDLYNVAKQRANSFFIM